MRKAGIREGGWKVNAREGRNVSKCKRGYHGQVYRESVEVVVVIIVDIYVYLLDFTFKKIFLIA